MKALLVSFFCLVYIDSFPQQPVHVTIEQREMSKGTHTAFVVGIPQADARLTEQQWRSYVNDRPLGIWLGGAAKQVGNMFRSPEKKVATERLRIEKVKDEFQLRAITIEDLSKQKLDVYAKIVALDSVSQLVAFFQFTDSLFIDEQIVDGEMILNLKNYIREFGIETYREAVNLELESARNALRDKEKELKKLESERNSFERVINRNESGISDAESEIRILESDFSKQEERIGELKRELRYYNKRSIEYESTKDEIKAEGKTKKQITSGIKKQKNKISKFRAAIKSEEIEITKNLIQQESQQKIINSQEQAINQIREKLENIR